MTSTETLSPEDAARRFLANPENIFIRLPELLAAFGMTLEELRPDLIAGTLVATGEPIPGGFTDVGFTGKAILRWMVATGREPDMTGKHDERIATVAPIN